MSNCSHRRNAPSGRRGGVTVRVRNGGSALKLQDHLPADHRLGTVYRYGAGLCGLALLVFGSLGFLNDLAFLSTRGERVAGLSSNGLLSLISLLVAVVLIAGAVIGGNAASTVNMAVGAVFLGSGFVNL